MRAINPYLNFNGNTEEVFTFYKSVFGGEFAMVMRFGEVEDQSFLSDDEKDRIMHIALPMGSSVLMGSDVPKAMGKVTTGTNIAISISADSRGEADRIYAGLAEGGDATMPMDDASWGDYFGMLTDKFGIQWMISYNENNSY